MQCGGPQWLPPRRAPFGRRAGQPSKGAPTDTARSPRASKGSTSPFAAAGRRVHGSQGSARTRTPSLAIFSTLGDKPRWLDNRERSCGSWRRRRAVRSLGQTGTRPRRVVRRPTADSLCDRMERGEEEAHDRRRVASQRTISADVKARPLPTSGRRKFPSGNFRSARDLEGAKRVRRGQAYRQTSTVPVCPETVPHASATATPQVRPCLPGIGECPHLSAPRGRRILLLILVQPLLFLLRPAHQRHAAEHHRHADESD